MEAEIPQAMYDTRMDEMVNDFAFRVEQQGLRLEDYLKYMGQTMDQFRASLLLTTIIISLFLYLSRISFTGTIRETAA